MTRIQNIDSEQIWNLNYVEAAIYLEVRVTMDRSSN